jgi:predicted glycogen debranching enzyme
MSLTWMDAKYRDWVVTPRMGKPVEIQALWFNALQIMRSFAGRFGDTARALRYGDLAAQAELAFNAQFWNEDAGCLYDVVDGAERDASIRPNQIFAASLTHSMLNQERMQRVVDVVARDLLTPYGLRSLSPGDPRYCGRYSGDLEKRDGAYHQGTIWAWLMGPFITAHVRVHERSAAARQQARRWLNGMLPHFNQAGLGQISEVFDGYAPHLPGGCVAQAWSVAEFLRSAIEDI